MQCRGVQNNFAIDLVDTYAIRQSSGAENCSAHPCVCMHCLPTRHLAFLVRYCGRRAACTWLVRICMLLSLQSAVGHGASEAEMSVLVGTTVWTLVHPATAVPMATPPNHDTARATAGDHTGLIKEVVLGALADPSHKINHGGSCCAFLSLRVFFSPCGECRGERGGPPCARDVHDGAHPPGNSNLTGAQTSRIANKYGSQAKGRGVSCMCWTGPPHPPRATPPYTFSRECHCPSSGEADRKEDSFACLLESGTVEVSDAPRFPFARVVPFPRFRARVMKRWTENMPDPVWSPRIRNEVPVMTFAHPFTVQTTPPRVSVLLRARKCLVSRARVRSNVSSKRTVLDCSPRTRKSSMKSWWRRSRK